MVKILKIMTPPLLSGMGLNPCKSSKKVVSWGWFTSECYICDMGFYDLFVHSNTVNSIPGSLYQLQCPGILYMVHGTVNSVQSTVYNVLCTLYNVYQGWANPNTMSAKLLGFANKSAVRDSSTPGL